jgi:hypothetical protein
VTVISAGLSPKVLPIAPLSLEAKIPPVLMISGTSFVAVKSPQIVHRSFTPGQQSGPGFLSVRIRFERQGSRRGDRMVRLLRRRGTRAGRQAGH